MQNFIKDLDKMDFEFDYVRITDLHYEMLTKGYHKGTAVEFTANIWETTDDCYAFGTATMI